MSGSTPLAQSGPGSNGKEELHHTFQSSRRGLLDRLILMVCQLIKGYLMTRIKFILCSYLYFYVVV